MLHRFWTCPHSVLFWQLLYSEKGVMVAKPPCPIDSQSALARWLLGWFAEASDEERGAMVQATYELWLARNEARDGKRIAPPHEIMEQVVSHMAEWRAVHDDVKPPREQQSKQKWKPPEEGWLKLNSDGAVSRTGNKGGAGAVIRDENGAFHAGLCHIYRGMNDPEMLEVLACRRGLVLAQEIQVEKIHVELDSQRVVNMLNNPNKEMSAAGPLIQELKALLSSFVSSRVTWVRRTANVAAHKLAKIGVGDELCYVWLGDTPDCVLDVISDDIPNAFD